MLKSETWNIASMIHKFFHKNPCGGVVKIEIMSNQQLSKEIHKPIVRISEKQKV